MFRTPDVVIRQIAYHIVPLTLPSVFFRQTTVTDASSFRCPLRAWRCVRDDLAGGTPRRARQHAALSGMSLVTADPRVQVHRWQQQSPSRRKYRGAPPACHVVGSLPQCHSSQLCSLACRRGVSSRQLFATGEPVVYHGTGHAEGCTFFSPYSPERTAL